MTRRSDRAIRRHSPSPTNRLTVWWMCLILLAVGSADLEAHKLGQSYLYLQVYEESVTGRFEIALSDLNPALGLSGTAGEITADNLDERIGFLEEYYLEHVTILLDDRPLAIEFTGHDLLDVRGGYVLMPFDIGGLEGVPEKLTFDYSVLFDEEPKHRGFLLVEYNWATGTFANENQISLVFRPGSHRKDFDLTSTGRWRGFLAVVYLGMEHIWEGIDHELFLLALLLPAVMRREDGKWQPVDRFTPALINVIKIVTAFTVAHSVTLSLAALGVVQLPGKFVEVMIAVSIAIAATDIVVPIFRGRVWLVVFGFGLFHGFGFAGALSEMGVLGEHMGLSLFGFNLGVEIGQVAIVAVIFPLLYLIRKLPAYRRFILPIAAAAMILISLLWAVERAFEVDIPMSESVAPLVEKVMS
jgi:hypothetical protein